MKKLILWFIPDRYRLDEENFRKAKLFVGTNLLTSCFSTFYFLSSYFSDMPHVSLAMFYNAAGFLVLPLLFRTNRFDLKFLGNTYIFIGATGVLVTVFYTGGLISSSLPWLSVLPIASLMLVDRRSGWVWTILSYVSITVVGFISWSGIIPFRDETGHTNLPIFNTFNLNGLGFMIFLIALVFENTTRTALYNLAQKNELLGKEKKRSDELLANILPQEIIEELKETGILKARLFNHVTVMFSDFVDFTQITEKLSPEELVAEIDFCFKGFDAITGKYGLEKIKTIGDAYLAVSGLPVEREDHAQCAVKAAIEFAEFIENRRKNGGQFGVRIGIHSGQVVAGIVGIKKYSYDIWGDTVNTAARMEQNSEEGRINISGATQKLIAAEIPCEYRGKIMAKHKGKIDMYFVERNTASIRE